MILKVKAVSKAIIELSQSLCQIVLPVAESVKRTKLIEPQLSDFSKSPEETDILQILFVRIFLRIGGGQLGLRLHSPNGQITESEKFGKL